MNQPSEQNRHRLCHLPASPASGIWRIAGPSRLGLLWLAPLLWLGVTPAKAHPGNIELTISCGANGNVDPKGSVVMPHMSDITYTATPNPGYKVEDWYFDGLKYGSDTTSFLHHLGDQDAIAVRVEFTRITHFVMTVAGYGGSLTPNSDAKEITVGWGDGVTFTAHPNPHYHVAQWTVDDAPVATGGATFTLPNITADHWVGITFALDSYTVQANAGPGGSLSPTGAVAVFYGDQQSFSATPEAGCDVACWWLDGRVVQTGGTTYWLDAIERNHTLQVTFGLPVLAISHQPATNTVVLSWPLAAEGWTLQATTNLSAAPVAWTNVPPPYPTDSDNFHVIEPVLARKKFYRLFHP
jgi:hypothetical protein